MRYSSKPTLELSAGMPSHEALRQIHLSLLRAILHNQEGVLESRDPEFLHDFRVALRRARSALTQVKGVFPAEEAERARAALSSMTRMTGPARDLDVFLEKLDAYGSGLPERVRQELVPVKELAGRWRSGQQPVPLIKSLKSLQSVLGDIHDLAVHREMARSIWMDIRPRPESSMPLHFLERRLGQLQIKAKEATEGRFQRFRSRATPW